MKSAQVVSNVLKNHSNWYKATDLADILKRERNRSDRSGQPASYVQFLFEGNLDCENENDLKFYLHFLNEFMEVIETNTRDYEPRIFFEITHIGVLLLDTSLENATQYINKISNKFISVYAKKKITNPVCKQIRIASYHLHQFMYNGHMEVSPFYTRDIQFKIKSPVKSGGQINSVVNTNPEGVSKNGNQLVATGLKVESVWTQTAGKYYLPIKRIIDIFGSLGGILIFTPAMLLIALLIKLSSRGPVIFRQERVGYRGHPFTFLKFRTMWMNNNDEIHRDYVHKLIHGKNNEINFGTTDKPLYKLENDPRITPLGHFLRKFSLDELPQFFNVLSGKMSLVGPRPPIPYEIEAYKNWHYRRILEVKPGITGLWQVYGRSKTTFDEMVRLDLQYVQSRSFSLDLKILYRTFTAVFNTKGAL